MPGTLGHTPCTVTLAASSGTTMSRVLPALSSHTACMSGFPVLAVLAPGALSLTSRP